MSTTQVATVQITCINKPDRNSSHESITHLGNSQGKWTKEQVIAWIDAKQFSFYAQDRFGTAWIGVVREAGQTTIPSHPCRRALDGQPSRFAGVPVSSSNEEGLRKDHRSPSVSACVSA